MRNLRVTLVTVLLVSVFGFMSARAAANAADTVLYNGKIFTGDKKREWVEAIAIRGNRVVAVGSNAGIQGYISANTQQIDLQARLVIPGLNDAHAHFLPDFGAVQLPPINIPGLGPTWAEALQQVSVAKTLAAPGQWIFLVVGEAMFLDPLVERKALDAITPDNPVILLTWTGHGAVINTAAIHAVGISEQEPDSFGGVYGRYPNSDLINGKLHEYAVFRALRSVISKLPSAAIRAHYLGMLQYLASYGYTSVQEIPLGLTRAGLLDALNDVQPAIRLRSICMPVTATDTCPQPARTFAGKDISEDDGNNLIRFGGVKWFADGTPIERSAALREPYVDTGTLGLLNFGADDLNDMLVDGVDWRRKQKQLVIHAVGDRAVDAVLDGMDETRLGRWWRVFRPRIEHGDLLLPEHFARAKQYGIVAIKNPIHSTYPVLPVMLGPERSEHLQPMRSLLDAGIKMAIGSDVLQANPYLDIMLAAIHPLNPKEAMSIKEAIIAYTQGSAYAEFEERRKGKLMPGYLADLAVLSQNILEVPVQQIPATKSVLTMVDGKVVWDAGEL